MKMNNVINKKYICLLLCLCQVLPLRANDLIFNEAIELVSQLRENAFNDLRIWNKQKEYFINVGSVDFLSQSLSSGLISNKTLYLYHIDDMQYIGYMKKKDQVVAVVRLPDQSVYGVVTADYIGNMLHKVRRIEIDKIELVAGTNSVFLYRKGL